MHPDKQAFVDARSLAIVGVSRTKGFGRYAWQQLRARGYEVFPINANADEIDGQRCYRRLEDLPGKVDGVVAVVPPAETLRVVEDCARLGVPRIWMQRGAESEAAVALAHEKGLAEVHDACILMHARPTGLHAFHGWVHRLMGKA